MKNKEAVLVWAIFIGLFLHHFFGYFFWDKIPNVNVYYISVYFCMDVWGLVVFLIATKNILKGAGCLGMVLGTFYFYKELNNPEVWVDNDYKLLAMFFLSIVNLFFIWYYTDIFKKLKP